MRIRYFPSPNPDEAIYNLYIRYGKKIGNDNPFCTIMELLGKMHLRVTPLFAGNLEYMCSELPEGTDFTPDYFIKNHTILPIYRPFVPADRYAKAVEGLKSGNLIAVYAGLGITAGMMVHTNGIKYCPECIEEDRKQYEHAYLHRTHQIPGMFACLKHQCLLNEADVSTDSREELVDIDEYAKNDRELAVPARLTDEQLSLTSDIEYLIGHYDEFGDFDLVKKKYTAQMHARDYISPSGLIFQVKLQTDFLTFYSNEFLSFLKSDFDIDDESNWLRVLTRKKIKAVHPIRNLLFIKFLFGDMSTFVNAKTEYQPFGEPPFPCLNPQSSHYRDLIIQDCRIKTNNHTSKAIGTFSCLKCGYTYSLNSDVYEISGFERVKPIDSTELGQKKPIPSIELEEKYKNQITSLLLKEPAISRRSILSIHNMAYRWLYKHHKEWLYSRVVEPLKHNEFYKNTRVNWEERDKETLVKVKQAVEAIYSEPIPIRITVRQIAKFCQYEALPSVLNKMPLTKEYISSCSEALEDYHIRKIAAVIQKIVVEERPLIRHIILREAGIPSNYYYDYDSYIELRLNQI